MAADSSDLVVNDTITTESAPPHIGSHWDIYNFDKWYIGVCASGIPGNVLTVVVLMSSRELRSKPSNMFMIHQSAMDTLMLAMTIITMIFNKSFAVEDNGTGQFICRFWKTNIIQTSLLIASGYNIMFLTLERCLAIIKPLRYDPTKVIKVSDLIIL